MFSSNWLESRAAEVTIEMVDPNITLAGLELALGSLYSDEVCLPPADVVSVVAAAALLQMDGLLAQCAEVMCACVAARTVVPFLEAAAAYGLDSVQRCCRRWLQLNLMTHVNDLPEVLRQLPAPELARLVASPELLVHQTEFSLYVLLKTWLFLRLHPEWRGAGREAVTEAHRFVQQRAASVSGPTLLETAQGAPLAGPFGRMRLQHLVLHPFDMEVLFSDRVVPTGWLGGLFRCHWLTLLRLDQGLVQPDWCRAVSQQQFEACALRCGRTLDDRRCTWRWTGFNFGLDLVMSHSRRQIALRRNSRQELPLLISQADRRTVLYRVRVVGLDERRAVRFELATELRSVQLARGQQVHVLTVPPEVAYPLLLSVNIMTAPISWTPTCAASGRPASG
ncbi:Germ cell-less protein-like 1 [Amphibalanus amphitrite]|uniref:Germ cell-less protein-like 1 n=2 Tax=Amphibalanus amphitrite TaxID=1232801 RepID=A0A6A4W9G6_AMPAM|nr:Germ cell-less protein-like 1 [Amphibalanus amphitrite]